MRKQRTLGTLVAGLGLALTITKVDEYCQERKAKKLKKAEDTLEVNIIVIEMGA